MIFDVDKHFAASMLILVSLIALLIFAVFEITKSEEEYLLDHECKLIHKNPSITHLEYDAATKMMVPRTYSGKKFYECKDGEWR